MLLNQALGSFLNETASSSPAPGGGTVSALAGSLAAALTSMVCRLTIGKKKYLNVEEEMTSTLGSSEELRNRMQKLIDADTSAFKEVMDAFGLPKESVEQKSVRADAIQAATKKATLVPLDLLRACSDCCDFVQIVADRGNANSLSDAGVAALLLLAAARGASMNIAINLSALEDEEFVSSTHAESELLERQVSERCDTIARAVRGKLAGR